MEHRLTITEEGHGAVAVASGTALARGIDLGLKIPFDKQHQLCKSKGVGTFEFRGLKRTEN